MAKPKNIRIHQLTDYGWGKLKEVCTNSDSEMCFDPAKDADMLTDPNHSVAFEEAKGELTLKRYSTQWEMAENINKALGIKDFESVQNNLHLWGWLTFALWDILQNDLKGKCKVMNKPYRLKQGKIILRESVLFLPAISKDFHKYQRHLVRTACHLHSKFGEDAKHLLLNKPNTRGDILEQLTSRHPFWNKTFMKVGKKLYYDDTTTNIKDKASGKGNGSPRELARIFRQFDVTWEMEDTTPSQFLSRLPKGFDEFR